MSIKHIITLMSICFIGAACGSDQDGSTAQSESQGDRSDTHPIEVADGLSFTGYVLNAFNVTVDDEEYADLENFYTKELTRLPQKAKEAGFDESYKVEFDAQIGFKDLWSNMQVYVAPDDSQGFQGSSRVDANGKFDVVLPEQALDATYRVRANKRISVTISKDGDVHKSCYNFSAIEKSILFSRETKPIVLDTFTTTITAYDCKADTSGGLKIPEAPTSNGTQASLRVGMSKPEVLDVMGRDYLKIVSTTKWCWNPGSADKICAVNYASDCRCSVAFDEDGLLSEQDNIHADLLDIASW